MLFFFFHFSKSACLAWYCLTRSSKTFFNPSAFVCSAGSTSLTVLSARTPLIMRKHFRSAGSGVRVSSTSLEVLPLVAFVYRSLESWAFAWHDLKVGYEKASEPQRIVQVQRLDSEPDASLKDSRARKCWRLSVLAVWQGSIRVLMKAGFAAASEATGLAVTHRSFDFSSQVKLAGYSLVFFSLLFNVANLLCNGLKGIFVVRVLRLKLWYLSV